MDRMVLLRRDIDASGTVDFEDFLTFSDRFAKTARQQKWERGDFDCSGTIDFADSLTLSANFSESVEMAFVVPEPATCGAIRLGFFLLFRVIVENAESSVSH